MITGKKMRRPFSCRDFCYHYSIPLIQEKGGEAGMKKPISPRAVAKEAAFWEMLKKSAKDPGTACRK